MCPVLGLKLDDMSWQPSPGGRLDLAPQQLMRPLLKRKW
jgi:hypothetical protein